MKLSEDFPGDWGITEPGSDDILTRLTLALDVMGILAHSDSACSTAGTEL